MRLIDSLTEGEDIRYIHCCHESFIMRVSDVLTVQRLNNVHTFYVKTAFLLALI